jgi:hypothetical protein
MSIDFMPPAGSRGAIVDGIRSDLYTNDPSGAAISPDYTIRKVKIYAVFESEIRSFGTFNTLEKLAFSAASGLASLAAAIWINAAFAGSATTAGTILSWVVAPVFCALALAALLSAKWAMRQRKSVWLAIDRESRSEIAPTISV